jgi:hypothetical protein
MADRPGCSRPHTRSTPEMSSSRKKSARSESGEAMQASRSSESARSCGSFVHCDCCLNVGAWCRSVPFRARYATGSRTPRSESSDRRTVNDRMRSEADERLPRVFPYAAALTAFRVPARHYALSLAIGMPSYSTRSACRGQGRTTAHIASVADCGSRRCTGGSVWREGGEFAEMIKRERAR